MKEEMLTDNILTGEIEQEAQDTSANILDGQIEIMGEVSTDYVGKDGFSPLAIVSKEGKETKISITDRRGTTTSVITDGEKGPEGKSAYQVAVDNGFTGTEAEWLESLKSDEIDLSIYATKNELQKLREENNLQII